MILLKRMTVVLIATLALVACAAAEIEPATESPETGSEPNLVPDTPDEEATSPETTREGYPAVGEETKPIEPYPVQSKAAPPLVAYPGPPSESETGPTSGVAYPVEVDLSSITPQPPDNSEPQEAPKPGVPNPLIPIAHQLSQELAKRLGLDVSQVTVVDVLEVDWPDSSLGCPEEGMAYSMVITPGNKVILEAAGETYNYHTAQKGGYVLCGENGRPVVD